MTRKTDALWIGGFIVGGLALYGLPALRLLVLTACMGFATLTTLLLVEAVVMLARALSPLRSTGWFKQRDAEDATVGYRIVTMEVAVAAAAAVVLAVAARWWQPLLGITVPLWLVVLMAVRTAGSYTLVALTALRRPIAGLGALFDIVFTLPLVALVGGSLETVVIISATMTWLIVVVAMHTNAVGKPIEDDGSAPEDRWRLGMWLGSLATHIRTPYLAALAGAAVVLPLAASIIVATWIMLPFYAAAFPKQSPSRFTRFVRGTVLAGIALLLTRTFGPGLFRLVFPASFGDGAWIEILAWSALAIIPVAIRTTAAKTANQWRQGASGAFSLVAIVTLGALYGTTGLLWGVVAGSVVAGMLTLTESSTAPIEL